MVLHRAEVSFLLRSYVSASPNEKSEHHLQTTPDGRRQGAGSCHHKATLYDIAEVAAIRRSQTHQGGVGGRKGKQAVSAGEPVLRGLDMGTVRNRLRFKYLHLSRNNPMQQNRFGAG